MAIWKGWDSHGSDNKPLESATVSLFSSVAYGGVLMGEKELGHRSETERFDLRNLILLLEKTHVQAQAQANRAVNRSMAIRNWLFGWYIVEFEQNGVDRGVYGEETLKRVSEELKARQGRGSSVDNLKIVRGFYGVYSDRIANSETLSRNFETQNDCFQTFPKVGANESSSFMAVLRISQTLSRKLVETFWLSWSRYYRFSREGGELKVREELRVASGRLKNQPQCASSQFKNTGSHRTAPGSERKPGASALRLIVNHISRNALASGFFKTFPILRITHVLDDTMQFIVGIETLPVAANSPYRTIAKSRFIFAKCGSTIGFQLITNDAATIGICCDHYVNMIAASVYDPKMPRSYVAMFLNNRLDNSSTFIIKQFNRMIQALLPPRFQARLRRLIALTVFSPTRWRTLKVGTVASPSNVVSKGSITIHHRTLIVCNLLDQVFDVERSFYNSKKPGASALRLIMDRISRNALASGLHDSRIQSAHHARKAGALRLIHRVRELAERYDRRPLPKMAERVNELASKVYCHLERMGFAWK